MNKCRTELEERIKTVIENVDRGHVIPSVGVQVTLLAVDEFVRGERLDEAEWWEHLVGAQHALEGLENCQPDCIYCARIKSLKTQSTSGSDRGGGGNAV